MGLIALDQQELAEITGYSLPKFQCGWLDRNGWRYVKNRAGSPVVAKVYAFQKLGVEQAGSESGAVVGALPDFSAVKVKR